MLALMMLFWIGTKFDAPTWYWVCWWISVIFKVIQFESNDEEDNNK